MSTENIDLEVNRIKQNLSDSYSELSALGATIPVIKSVDNLATCVSTLQTSHIITQNGDNLITNYGTNINHDGKNTIKSLALSQRPGYLNFLVADDDNSTVKFSLEDLKIWINTPTPVKQGRFVAASEAKIAYSDDEGLTWTEVENTINIAPKICYGNGIFVMVGGTQSSQTSIAAYSTDGINWIKTQMLFGFWNTVTYSNGKFVAINFNNRYWAYSTDGINWTQVRGQDQYFISITYGDGKFVAIQSGLNGRSAYSTDGINWTDGNTINGFYALSIVYGDNKFVAVGAAVEGTNSNKSAYSTDGISWSYSSNLISSKSWSEINYIDGKFIAFSTDGDYAYSSNGIDWTFSSVPESTIYWQDSVCGKNKLIVVGGSTSSPSNKYIYSSDGITWQSGTLPSSQNWRSIAYGEI